MSILQRNAIGYIKHTSGKFHSQELLANTKQTLHLYTLLWWAFYFIIPIPFPFSFYFVFVIFLLFYLVFVTFIFVLREKKTEYEDVWVGESEESRRSWVRENDQNILFIKY